LRVACSISASSVRASMMAWYTRRQWPSEATKHALGLLEMAPRVVLRREDERCKLRVRDESPTLRTSARV
jgi:hypothetical protein